jgi:hypothetical protein
MSDSRGRRRNIPVVVGSVFAGLAILIILVAIVIFLMGVSDTAMFELAEVTIVVIAVLSLPALVLGATGLHASARLGSRGLAIATVIIGGLLLASAMVLIVIFVVALVSAYSSCGGEAVCF